MVENYLEQWYWRIFRFMSDISVKLERESAEQFNAIPLHSVRPEENLSD